MAGNKSGGQKVYQARLKQLGSPEAVHDWYVELGRMGGSKSTGGGFSGRPDLASKAGAKGGRRKELGESCINGHELTEETTTQMKNGHLKCRTCLEV